MRRVCLVLSLMICAAGLRIPTVLSSTNTAHPVLYLEWEGLLLGGTVEGRWEEYHRVAPLLRGGENYRLYRLRECLGCATGGHPERLTNGYYGFGIKIAPAPDNTAGAFAVGGEWNALPRLPRVESVSQRVYVDAVAAFLKGKRIPTPEVRITQVMRVDLEGDGTDEVLVSATNAEPHRIFFEPRRGDYSLVILRKLAGDTVATIELAGYYCAEEPILDGDHPPRGVVWTIRARWGSTALNSEHPPAQASSKSPVA